MGGIVDIVEVGPRDGLQSFAQAVTLEQKLAMIELLVGAGLRTIEVTGFAHPAKIPQFADAEALCERLPRVPGVAYRGMAPNARGAQRAVAAAVDEVVGLITASEAYLRRNQNMTPDEAIEQGIEAFRIADAAGLRFTMAVGLAFWCAYEGAIPEERVITIMQRFRAAGIQRFYLAASVGLESPVAVGQLFAKAHDAVPDAEIGFHVHNLGGRAPVLAWQALSAGARWIEGAICGIGGGIAMPGHLPAVGNYATEDLVALMADSGIETGLDAQAVISAAQAIAALLGIEPRSFAGNGASRQAVRAPGARKQQPADIAEGDRQCA